MSSGNPFDIAAISMYASSKAPSSSSCRFFPGGDLFSCMPGPGSQFNSSTSAGTAGTDRFISDCASHFHSALLAPDRETFQVHLPSGLITYANRINWQCASRSACQLPGRTAKGRNHNLITGKRGTGTVRWDSGRLNIGRDRSK
jgi:hypothetical protein